MDAEIIYVRYTLRLYAHDERWSLPVFAPLPTNREFVGILSTKRKVVGCWRRPHEYEITLEEDDGMIFDSLDHMSSFERIDQKTYFAEKLKGR